MTATGIMGVNRDKSGKQIIYPATFLLGVFAGMLLALPIAYPLLRHFNPELLSIATDRVRNVINITDQRYGVLRLLEDRRAELNRQISAQQAGAQRLDAAIRDQVLKQIRAATILNQGRVRYQAVLNEDNRSPVYFLGETHANIESFEDRLGELHAETITIAIRLQSLRNHRYRKTKRLNAMQAQRQQLDDALDRWQSGRAITVTDITNVIAQFNPFETLGWTDTDAIASIETSDADTGADLPGIDTDIERLLQQSTAPGFINWSDQQLYALGEGFPVVLQASHQTPQTHLSSQTLDIAVARLRKTLHSLSVNEHTTLGHLADLNLTVASKLASLINAAQIVEHWHGMDGSLQLLLQLPLVGHQGLSVSLAPLERNRLLELGSDRIWPESEPANKIHTGLIVDARMLGIEPALFPRILTESGYVVFDLTGINLNRLVAQGLVIYSRSLQELKTDARIGDNPLVVMASGVAGQRPVNVLVDEQVAEVVMAADVRSGFLSEARVGIVID